MIQTNPQPQRGFALLITILTVGVIVSATMAIVELSRMQLKLSVDSRDAEIAFSAANAAKECAQYIRTTDSSTVSIGGRIRSRCLDTSVDVTSNLQGLPTSGPVGSNGNSVSKYYYLLNWESSGVYRCSEINMIVVYANTANISVGNNSVSLQRFISNYPTNTMTCRAGSECTIISAAGYNSACNSRTSAGVLKREVLLEY